jgi:hypothetical protein
VKPIPALLFVFGLTIAFPTLGVALNEAYVLSLSTIVGAVYAALFVRSHGVRSTHVAGAVMLLAFLATAAFRHGPGTYVLSLGALTLAAAPMTAPFLAGAYTQAFHRGLMAGLRVTLAWMGLSIVLQITGLTALAGPFEPALVRPEAGSFLNYYRPTAGFAEPSHVGLYLCFVFVYLDLVREAGSRHGVARWLAAGAVLAGGSVSAVVTLGAYLIGRNLRLPARRRGPRSGPSMWRRLAVAAAAVAVLGYGATEVFPSVADEYVVRLVKAYEDALSMNLVGSEGSRINALLALPDYWVSNGPLGALFGTGYANYRPWLLGTYGDLGEFATFARGEIDNVFVAVLLSTGVFGFFFYLRFVGRALGHWGTRDSLAILLLFIAFNFSIGFLISGLYWGLLFMLAVGVRRREAARAAGDQPMPTASMPRRPASPALAIVSPGSPGSGSSSRSS